MDSKYLKQIILICGITVLFSCGGKTSNINTDMRNVNAEHIAKSVSSSGLMKQISSELIEIDTENCVSIDDNEILTKISDIKYIYLKTEEPIGYVNKVIIHKNKIFVVDALSSQKIFIFDMKGNLIKIVSDKGGGPQEYLDLGDVVISDEEIIVADGKKLCRLYYTLDGKYIRTEKCLPCIAFALLGDKFILHLDYHQSFDYKTTPNLVVSINDSAIRRGLLYHKIQRETTPGKFNYNYIGDLFFSPAVSDTVYQILTDSTFVAKYLVKQKKSVWQLYNEELLHGEISQRIRDGYSRFNSVFLETEKNIHFQLVLQDDELGSLVNKSYWYNKGSKQTYISKIDMTFKTEIPNILVQGMSVWGNYYVGVIPPEQIEAIREYQTEKKGTKDTLDIQNEELRNIINIKDDPNQAIVLYKLDFDSNSEKISTTKM